MKEKVEKGYVAKEPMIALGTGLSTVDNLICALNGVASYKTISVVWGLWVRLIFVVIDRGHCNVISPSLSLLANIGVKGDGQPL